MIAYPVELERNDTFIAVVPDLPGCRSYGDTEAEALTHALNACRAMVAALVKERQTVPAPSSAEGRRLVRLPMLDTLKIELHREMQRQEVTQVELARRMRKTQKDVFRLLDLTHSSRVDQIEMAFAALGLALDVIVRREA